MWDSSVKVESFRIGEARLEDGLSLYGFHTFDLTDGDDSSSYEVVYRDGTCVTI